MNAKILDTGRYEGEEHGTPGADESDLERDLPGIPKLPRELGYLDSIECADFWFREIRDFAPQSLVAWAWSSVESDAGEQMGMYARYFFRLLEPRNPHTGGKPHPADAMSAEILLGVQRRAMAALRETSSEENVMQFYCTSVEVTQQGLSVKLGVLTDDEKPAGKVRLELQGETTLGPFEAGKRYELALREIAPPLAEGAGDAPPPDANSGAGDPKVE